MLKPFMRKKSYTGLAIQDAWKLCMLGFFGLVFSVIVHVSERAIRICVQKRGHLWEPQWQLAIFAVFVFPPPGERVELEVE